MNLFRWSVLFSLALCLTACVVLVASCGDDDDEEEDTGATDADDDDGNSCETMPDLVVDWISFSVTPHIHGTAFSFAEIVLCNYGGATADANHKFAFFLMTSADFTGDFYLAHESEPLVGLSPSDCATYTLYTVVGDVPEGYYYVYIYADRADEIVECNESNNWARSDEPVHVTPDESEPL